MKSARIIKKLRGLSHTWRWNYHPRVRQESVAEHSYWVAVVSSMICSFKDMDASFRALVLDHALTHDAEECITGDLPAPVKRGRSWDDVKDKAEREIFGSAMQPVSNDVKFIVKMADTLAALLFADEEVKLGNTHFIQIRGELIYTAYGYCDDHFDVLLSGLGFNETEGIRSPVEMSHL